MSKTEFLIYEAYQDGNVTRVSGIVNKGTVSLNTRFASVQGQQGVTSPVDLSVSNIVAYRKQLPELPTGMSGELQISGDGGNQLAKHCMLTD